MIRHNPPLNHSCRRRLGIDLMVGRRLLVLSDAVAFRRAAQEFRDDLLQRTAAVLVEQIKRAAVADDGLHPA